MILKKSKLYDLRFVMVAIAGLSVAACSSDDEQASLDGPQYGQQNRRAAFNETPVEVLYNRALDELMSGIYRNAAAMFDEVERQHPYSVWARRAMLMSAYAQYLDGSYDLSILSAERFLALHPGNSNAPYANYLIAICYYEQISDVGRDQKMTELALARLTEVARRYPSTQYARDARLKIDLTRDHLAGKEMAIGRYYANKGQHVAAINRFRNVVIAYETTTHVPEALHRLVENYLTIGLTGEAQTVAAVLGYNYPSTDWYQDSFELLQGVDLQPQMLNDEWSKQLRQNAGGAAGDDASVAGRAALLGRGDPDKSKVDMPAFGDDVPAAAPTAPVQSAPVSGADADDGGSWFGNIFGGNDDDAVEAPVDETPELQRRSETFEESVQRLRERSKRIAKEREAEQSRTEPAPESDEENSSIWDRVWPF